MSRLKELTFVLSGKNILLKIFEHLSHSSVTKLYLSALECQHILDDATLAQDFCSALKHLIDPLSGNLTELRLENLGGRYFGHSHYPEDGEDILVNIVSSPSSLRVLCLINPTDQGILTLNDFNPNNNLTTLILSVRRRDGFDRASLTQNVVHILSSETLLHFHIGRISISKIQFLETINRALRGNKTLIRMTFEVIDDRITFEVTDDRITFEVTDDRSSTDIFSDYVNFREHCDSRLKLPMVEEEIGHTSYCMIYTSKGVL